MGVEAELELELAGLKEDGVLDATGDNLGKSAVSSSGSGWDLVWILLFPTE